MGQEMEIAQLRYSLSTDNPAAAPFSLVTSQSTWQFAAQRLDLPNPSTGLIGVIQQGNGSSHSTFVGILDATWDSPR